MFLFFIIMCYILFTLLYNPEIYNFVKINCMKHVRISAEEEKYLPSNIAYVQM